MNNKRKTINSVKMMRDIRNKLTKRYLQNPELEMKDLIEIRQKYNLVKNIEKRKLFIN